MRYVFEIAFDGTNYHGWQNQPNAISVQEILEKNISILYQQKIILVGASRTDAGVHIKQTYAHFDCELDVPKHFIRRLNFMLPADIAVKNLRQVPDSFHTRFDAIQREYQYLIHYEKNPYLFNRSYYFHYGRLDLDVMNACAKSLTSYYDYEAFCKRNSDNKTTHCRIDFAEWTMPDKDSILFTIKADRYLRGMIKGLVGTMIKAGRGIYTVEEFKEVVATKNKPKVNFAVPGSALYLTEVRFPEAFYELPII
ncbi:MAG: tRNA pseudouridine synthase [Bacteroidota bacterium]|jgi:tRNA pseudouridine38-40 synthase